MTPALRSPLRGEIWFVQLPVDPPEKGRRPVVIVSHYARNRHQLGDQLLVISVLPSIHKAEHPTHLFLDAGETGLSEDSIARAEDITVVRKANLHEPRSRYRTMSHRRICELSEMVKIAMGCF